MMNKPRYYSIMQNPLFPTPNICRHQFHFLQALKSNRHLLAQEIFDFGVEPNKAIIIAVLNTGNQGLITHVLSSGKLSAALIRDTLKDSTITPQAETTLYSALADIYESGIRKIVDELQIHVNNAQGPKRNYSLGYKLFNPESSPIFAKALKKFIEQIKSQEFFEFSAEEIAALKVPEVTLIVERYQKDVGFPAYLLKIHNRNALDKMVQDKRGKGETIASKIGNTILAVEVDLRQQQDRLAKRLAKTTSAAKRENITAKLDAIMAAQEKIILFKNDKIDLATLIAELHLARDEARNAQATSNMRQAVKASKNFFKSGAGDSDTAHLLTQATKDLMQLMKVFDREQVQKKGSDLPSITRRIPLFPQLAVVVEGHNPFYLIN